MSEASTSDQDDRVFLSVHPSVVFKLGRDLITDDVQAVVELVKNSYDAGATRCDVFIDPSFTDPAGPTSAIPQKDGAKPGEPSLGDEEEEPARATTVPAGRIRISDDGDGMTRQQIIKGWLTVSASQKGELRRLIQRGEIEGRAPLGDKGLGRLGAQRLGRKLILTTTPRVPEGGTRADVPAHRITIDWDAYNNVESLQNVPILLESIAADESDHGSVIEIIGLRDLPRWAAASDQDRTDLQKSFSGMISPYRSQADTGFRVGFRIGAVVIDLHELASAVLEHSTVSYELAYASGRLETDVAVSLAYLRPPVGREDIADFDRFVGADSGVEFTAWLWANRADQLADLNILAGGRRGWLHASGTKLVMETEPELITRAEFAELAGGDAELPKDTTEAERAALIVADPGPFTGRVDAVILRRDPTELFSRRDDYSAFVKALSGVRVYRDGFGIRLAPDWLNLASQWTSAGSYYTLRPDNTLGYINISSKDNEQLRETTNREAFRETPVQRNFLRLQAAWLSFGAEVQEEVRRGYNAFRTLKKQQLAHLDEVDAVPSAIARRARDKAEILSQSASALHTSERRLERLKDLSKTFVDREHASAENLFHDAEDRAAFSTAAREVSEIYDEVSAAVGQAQEQLAEFEHQRALLDLLVGQIDEQQEQLEEVWESIALGLVAETLSHELMNLSERLKTRSSQALGILRAEPNPDQRIWSFAEDTRATGAALAKQVSRLDPSLRYVRDRRDDVRIGEFVTDLANYYQQLWSDRGITVTATVARDFTVKANRGRLQQVLDNLLLNSGYWVTRSGLPTTVGLTVDDFEIQVEDSGPGIDPTVEHSLFEPFVTKKPRNQGRGLGLFVVRQLLAADGATIRLAGPRNERGRLHTFVLDFSADE